MRGLMLSTLAAAACAGAPTTTPTDDSSSRSTAEIPSAAGGPAPAAAAPESVANPVVQVVEAPGLTGQVLAHSDREHLYLSSPRAAVRLDPARGVFEPVAALPLAPARGYAAFARVFDGARLVAVTGGGDDRGAIYVYDPTLDRWIARGPTRRPLSAYSTAAGIVADDDTLLVFGGRVDGALTTGAWSVSLATGDETPLPDLPRPRAGAQVAAWNGGYAVVGGLTSNTFRESTLAEAVDVYDPSASSWHSHVPPASGYVCDGSRGGSLGSRLYLFAPPYVGLGCPSGAAILEPGGTWSTTSARPKHTGRSVIAVHPVGDTLLVVGADQKRPGGGEEVPLYVLRYDPRLDTFTRLWPTGGTP